jgi:hypothetical protein
LFEISYYAHAIAPVFWIFGFGINRVTVCGEALAIAVV